MIDIEKLNGEVGAEYGKVLPVRMIKKGVPHFDWNSVNLPESVLKENEQVVKNILRHEYGHLFINPKDLNTSEVLYYLAKVHGFKNPRDVVNIISDLIVDSTLITRHGKEYLRLIEHYLSTKNLPKPLKMMAAFYAAHARMMGIATNIDGNEYKKFGEKLHRVLLGPYPLYQRVDGALELIKKVLGDSVQVLPHSVTVIVVNRINPRNVETELRRAGLHKNLWSLRGLGRGGGFGVSSNPAHIAERYMEIHDEGDVKMKLNRTVRYGTWNIGDELQTLDVLKSVELTGLLIPGFTAVKRELVVGRDMEEHTKSVAIVLDCSGSMHGEVFTAAQIAVLNLLRIARQNKIRVAFIPFASGIDLEHIILPTTNYEEIESLLLRIQPAGGTELREAIERAIMMEVDRIYLITDSVIADVEEVLPIISTMDKRIYVVSKIYPDNWVSDVDDVYFVDPETLMVLTKEEVM